MFKRLSAWLTADWVRLGRDGKWVLKRLHGAVALALIVVALVVGLVIGFAAGFSYPYRTVPPPKVPPSQIVPHCGSGDQHSLGNCLPQPKKTGARNAAAITASTSGPDFSNNNPVYGTGPWIQIAGRSSFAIFKVNESTGYVDPTAAPMVRYARSRRLSVTGYDFLHVCLVDPAAEAGVFVRAYNANVGHGYGTLSPVGDVEYPPSPQCNVRTWLQAWVNAVHSQLGRWPAIYTGAWWWNPHVGCWWPAHALAWVSGYTGSLSAVPLPCGQGHIDLWQFSDHGFNGYDTADLSQWEDGVARFRFFAQTTPSKPKPPATPSCWGKDSRSPACQSVRRAAGSLNAQEVRQAGFVKVSQHNASTLTAQIAALEARLAQVNVRLKAETAKAAALHAQRCALRAHYNWRCS